MKAKSAEHKEEFADAGKILTLKENIHGMMVYTTMAKQPIVNDDGKFWLQTIIIDTTVQPMKPLASFPHVSAPAAIQAHNTLVGALKKYESLVKLPLTAEFAATEAQLKERISELEGLLNKTVKELESARAEAAVESAAEVKKASSAKKKSSPKK